MGNRPRRAAASSWKGRKGRRIFSRFAILIPTRLSYFTKETEINKSEIKRQFDEETERETDEDLLWSLLERDRNRGGGKQSEWK